jgi:hypothetical protein
MIKELLLMPMLLNDTKRLHVSLDYWPHSEFEAAPIWLGRITNRFIRKNAYDLAKQRVS